MFFHFKNRLTPPFLFIINLIILVTLLNQSTQSKLMALFPATLCLLLFIDMILYLLRKKN